MFKQIVLLSAFSVCGAFGLTLREFLFEGVGLPDELDLTHQVALLEQSRIDELRSSVDNLVSFLPTNEAWSEDMAKFDALLDDDKAAGVRYDLLLATSADVSGRTDWDSLVAAAEANNGVLDTAYGTPYFLYDDGRVCTATWDDASASYTEGSCARVNTQAIDLDDAKVYMIDRLALPEALEDEIKSLM